MDIPMKNVQRLHNRVADGKQSVGVLSNFKKSFVCFVSFVTKKN